ncbi:MAG: hypothetical protein HUU20_07135 [Pirellulales bacterium]|nr:hypothetical protein [Pirellulales bacterium]
MDLFQHPPILDHDWFEPVLRESWLYRPYSASAMAGMMAGTELLDNWVEQRQGYVAGYRLGKDVDDFWGFETRIGGAFVRLDDTPLAQAAQQAADDAAGLSPDDPYRRRFDAGREADLFQWDVDLLYYPCGDAPLRPYGMFGLGLMHVSFIDRLSQPFSEIMYTMPLAIGLKRRCTEYAAIRLEIADTLAFGDRLDTFHEFSLTAGIELRFGGTRKAYWPWNPGRHYW